MYNHNYCPICKSTKLILIRNKRIRCGKNIWTKNNYKILQCLNCYLVFLEKRSKELIDNKIFRKKFDGSNTVYRYQQFNKSREKNKLNRIRKFINFKNKTVLESNCGAATNLDLLKNECRLTAGLDSKIYKNHVEKKHFFFSSINELKKSQMKFDIILSLSELEHQFDLLSFLETLKSKLKRNGIIVFRIPNYNNIYRYILGEKFLKYDFRG